MNDGEIDHLFSIGDRVDLPLSTSLCECFQVDLSTIGVAERAL
jgi:hypothetical protein